MVKLFNDYPTNVKSFLTHTHLYSYCRMSVLLFYVLMKKICLHFTLHSIDMYKIDFLL